MLAYAQRVRAGDKEMIAVFVELAVDEQGRPLHAPRPVLFSHSACRVQFRAVAAAWGLANLTKLPSHHVIPMCQKSTGPKGLCCTPMGVQPQILSVIFSRVSVGHAGHSSRCRNARNDANC
jgi:hypothetical protein